MIFAIILILVAILVPLIIWQVRSRREQVENEAEPDVGDRVDVIDLYRSGDDLF